ncbi:MAG: peptide chain release factor N(5)-glutamine methyltransferase [Eubacterium sp.]|nr:peptide chain release factor N(5)-glutamine methyltransferase [Eubacterium sp.]
MLSTIKTVYTEGQEKLVQAGIHDAAFDARELLSFVMGIPFRDLPLHYADEVADEQLSMYEELLKRRILGEPLQYITGEQEFMGLPFHVDERVLIPRLDTEILAENALEYVSRKIAGSGLYNAENRNSYIEGNCCAAENTSFSEADRGCQFRVLDLCCGSGAIGLSIAALACDTNHISQIYNVTDATCKGFDKSRVVAGEDSGSRIEVILADISQDALDVARQNAEELGVSERVSFIRSDLFEAFSDNTGSDASGTNEVGACALSRDEDSSGAAEAGREGFDLIVSNPPYVRSDVIPTLGREVKDHEPMLALDGGADGLDIYRRIAEEAPGYIKPGGCLMMEIGADQAEDVESLLASSFHDIQVIKDLAGLDRVIIARY